MKVHEYQAKSILARYGVAVPRGEVTNSPAEAREIAKRLGGRAVVKAQIHAGGRGKGGGVKVAKDAAEARDARQEDPRHERSSRHQTGPGRPAWSRRSSSRRRSTSRASSTSASRSTARAGCVVVMASQSGGMEIEEVAAKDAGGDRARGRRSGPPACSRSRRASSPSRSGSPARAARTAIALMQALFRAYVETDASLVEINPLVVTKHGRRARARRQDDLRRQRALPPPGDRGAARPRRGGPARGRGHAVRPELHQARRQHRLHGQRRRPGDGDDGHHQALRRRAGELPRRRRRRQRGAGHDRVPDHPVRPEREGRSSSTSSAAS